MVKYFSKLEFYVMIVFEFDIFMIFGGNSDQLICYIEIKSIGSMKFN